MKTNSESSAPATSPADNTTQDLRPQLNAIIGFAERLKMKPESDETVHQLLATAHGLLNLINRESTDAGGSGRAAEPGPNARCDVLYIEDNSKIFASVKLLLGSRRALKVLQATNGETGIALAQTYAPKLILLDLDLPDIHGSEVIQHLQKSPATAPIPVVVISGDATPSQIERLLVFGARNYLTKPFQVESFLAVIDDVMQESSAVRIA